MATVVTTVIVFLMVKYNNKSSVNTSSGVSGEGHVCSGDVLQKQESNEQRFLQGLTFRHLFASCFRKFI